ncbi:IS66 family insertion sequence element accessory protein TnpB [Mesorhizobium sp. NZP2077]|uniref:IS66 family insertion sequence element accessory protein TnpB n=1 Tax=Mesorhizobium sp. NZP2077 TaxID=2483404 RepID=UPI0032B2CFD9
MEYFEDHLGHDGLGACLFSRRLETGRFIWPNVEGGAVEISPAQLSYLLSGMDWRNPQETWRPTRVGCIALEIRGKYG